MEQIIHARKVNVHRLDFTLRADHWVKINTKDDVQILWSCQTAEKAMAYEDDHRLVRSVGLFRRFLKTWCAVTQISVKNTG